MLPVTIVLVEDDPGHARLIEKNIRRAGVNNEIVHFENGTAALEHLLATKAVATSAEVAQMTEAWATAFRDTPHGQPVVLKPAS